MSTMPSHNYRTHLLFTAVILHIIAVFYLYVMDLRFIQPLHVEWTSPAGYFLLAPFLFLVAYSWGLLILVLIGQWYSRGNNSLNLQVCTEDAEWKAKAVLISDKHKGLEKLGG